MRSKGTLVGVGRVGKHAESALGNLSRVLHFKGSGSRVSGVGKEFQSGVFAAVIEPLKVRMQEDNFAPHFEIVGGIGGQLKRNSLDGAHIDGHVVALQAVASGKRARKQSVLVAKRNRYPVKFEFGVPKYGIAGHKLLSTVYEFVEFLIVVGVGKT